jgi:hypothetical protein
MHAPLGGRIAGDQTGAFERGGTEPAFQTVRLQKPISPVEQLSQHLLDAVAAER